METTGPALNEELEAFARQRGADLFGVADLAPAQDFIEARGGAATRGYPLAVSLGMRLSDDIVDQHDPAEPPSHSRYWHHVYDVVTPYLDFLAYDVTRWLVDHGFRAFPAPASTPYHYKTLKGIFSHRLAAHLAGVGRIGKSCLLLAPPFGSRVRLVSVLTDALLEAGKPLDGRCGGCRLCVEACPVGAISGVEFEASAGREARLSARKCSDYRRDHACGRCVSSCPADRRRSRSSRAECGKVV